MKRHINFGSIPQFREVIKNVQHSAMHVGQDKNGEAVFNRNNEMPIITAIATEKIHGTNAAVCYSNPDGLWVQSRENIITTEKDNAGCAFFVESKKEIFMTLINDLAEFNKIDLDKNIISIYFEFCGGNIQKNSCVSGLDKRAIVFAHFKVSQLEPLENEKNVWYPTKQYNDAKQHNIFNVLDFLSYQIKIDFNKPLLYQNEMIDFVKKIEENSPIGKQFGIENNIGEGLVFTFWFKDNLHRFKVKGEKHSASKVKTLKTVDDVKEQAKIDFAQYATPSWRLEQMWQKVFGIDNEIQEPSIKSTGNFLKTVMTDIVKEELDVLNEKGLEPKDISNYVNTIARSWLNQELDKLA